MVLGSSLDSATGGARGEVDAIWVDMLEMVAVVLSAGRWVQVGHTITDTEKLGKGLCELPSHSYHSFYWENFHCKVTCLTRQLLKKLLVVFNPLGLMTILSALFGLDQVGE